MSKAINKSEWHFPIKTLQKMIDIAEGHGEEHLANKLNEILTLGDVDKMNRWFGYYQCKMEERGYLTLDQIINWVRDEKRQRDT